MLPSHAAALAVVGGHEADVVAALQPGVDDDDRDPARVASAPAAASAESSSGASTMPATPRLMKPSTSEICESRSSSRSGPRQMTVHVELLCRFLRAGVNALPEHVRRAFRDHRDRGLSVSVAATAGRYREHRHQHPDQQLLHRGSSARSGRHTPVEHARFRWRSLPAPHPVPHQNGRSCSKPRG